MANLDGVNAASFVTLKSSLSPYQIKLINDYVGNSNNKYVGIGMLGEIQDITKPNQITAAIIIKDKNIANELINAEHAGLDYYELKDQKSTTVDIISNLEEWQQKLCSLPIKTDVMFDGSGYALHSRIKNTSDIERSKLIYKYMTYNPIMNCMPMNTDISNISDLSIIYNKQIVLQPNGEILGRINLATRSFRWHNAIYKAYALTEPPHLTTDAAKNYQNRAEVEAIRDKIIKMGIPKSEVFTKLNIVKGTNTNLIYQHVELNPNTSGPMLAIFEIKPRPNQITYVTEHLITMRRTAPVTPLTREVWEILTPMVTIDKKKKIILFNMKIDKMSKQEVLSRLILELIYDVSFSDPQKTLKDNATTFDLPNIEETVLGSIFKSIIANQKGISNDNTKITYQNTIDINTLNTAIKKFLNNHEIAYEKWLPGLRRYIQVYPINEDDNIFDHEWKINIIFID